uniref:Uncharacterized protein n=1 Tax=Knipowitschia caucasica TaxID=637954 RepID=A0AAV2JW41_KNICA
MKNIYTSVKISLGVQEDPSEEARKIRDDPSMRECGAPLREEVVRENALTLVRVRGGDASDKAEVLGEYIAHSRQ